MVTEWSLSGELSLKHLVFPRPFVEKCRKCLFQAVKSGSGFTHTNFIQTKGWEDIKIAPHDYCGQNISSSIAINNIIVTFLQEI